jgi:hypothetical protein
VTASGKEKTQFKSGRGNPGWKKGQSGNPGGRPKVAAEVKELARNHGPAAVARLAKLMMSKNQRVAVAACVAILDRGYGKPAQAVAVTGEGGGPIEVNSKLDVSGLSVEQLRTLASIQLHDG